MDVYNQSIPAGWSTADTRPVAVADRVEPSPPMISVAAGSIDTVLTVGTLTPALRR